jgi:hypothetical protein
MCVGGSVHTTADPLPGSPSGRGYGAAPGAAETAGVAHLIYRCDRLPR